MKANAAIDWQTFILFTSVHILARAIAAIDWQTFILVTSVRVLTRTIYCCKGKTTIISGSDHLDLRDVIALEISSPLRFSANGLKFLNSLESEMNKKEQRHCTMKRGSKKHIGIALVLHSFTLLRFNLVYMYGIWDLSTSYFICFWYCIPENLLK